METEMIDKLFLELSQISKAKTKRELDLEKALRLFAHRIYDKQKYKFNCGMGYCDDCPLKVDKLACVNPNQRDFSK